MSSKISDVIRHLEGIRERHGDIEVWAVDPTTAAPAPFAGSWIEEDFLEDDKHLHLAGKART